MIHDPNEQADRQRMIMAVVISLLILWGFHFFTKPPQDNTLDRPQALQSQDNTEVVRKTDVVGAPAEPRSAEDVLGEGGRLPIRTARVHGSISLKGARLDDLLLSDHFIATDSTDHVRLLSPAGTDGAYYVDSGWLGAAGAALPDAESIWRVKAGSPKELRGDGRPVTLQWENGAGLLFEKDIALDANYLFTMTQRVINNTTAEVALNSYMLTAQHGVPEDFSGFFVLHEGPVYFLGEEHEEPDYSDLAEGEIIEKDNTRGWLGFTAKYWMVALLPEAQQKFNARLVAGAGQGRGAPPVFQADTVMPKVAIAPGGSFEQSGHVYAGAKDLDLITDYQAQYGFDHLELGIDFGMWYFITKPLYNLFHFLISLTGSVALAIILLTLVIRAVVFPLASKSFRSMAKMRVVGPQMKELQEKFKDDKPGLQMAIYELYKKEDVNPFSGCWPMLIQIPIFFALYKVILISVSLRHAPFWGWIDDMSAPDPTSMFNLFGLLNFDVPDAFKIGAWPLMFCFSMILQKRISPPMADEMQEKLQTYFPYIVTVMLAHFSVGLVIYWTWSNVLGTLQQFYILKKVGGEETSLVRGHSARRKKKPTR